MYYILQFLFSYNLAFFKAIACIYEKMVLHGYMVLHSHLDNQIKQQWARLTRTLSDSGVRRDRASSSEREERWDESSFLTENYQLIVCVGGRVSIQFCLSFYQLLALLYL